MAKIEKEKTVKSVSFRDSIQMFSVSATGWNNHDGNPIKCQFDAGLPYLMFTCDSAAETVLVSYASIKSVTVV